MIATRTIHASAGGWQGKARAHGGMANTCGELQKDPAVITDMDFYPTPVLGGAAWQAMFKRGSHMSRRRANRLILDRMSVMRSYRTPSNMCDGCKKGTATCIQDSLWPCSNTLHRGRFAGAPSAFNPPDPWHPHRTHRLRWLAPPMPHSVDFLQAPCCRHQRMMKSSLRTLSRRRRLARLWPTQQLFSS